MWLRRLLGLKPPTPCPHQERTRLLALGWIGGKVYEDAKLHLKTCRRGCRKHFADVVNGRQAVHS